MAPKGVHGVKDTKKQAAKCVSCLKKEINKRTDYTVYNNTNKLLPALPQRDTFELTGLDPFRCCRTFPEVHQSKVTTYVQAKC